MHQQSSIATVVQNHVRAFASRTFFAGEFKNAVRVIPVHVQAHAFVGKHGCACGYQSGSGVVLCRENVA